MKSLREADDDRWGSVAQVCRWGIVLVAMTLVPGVAFLGQGVGQWLRARSENGWLSDAVHVTPGHASSPDFAPATPVVEFAVHDPPPDPAESAAMYAGRSPVAEGGATLAAFEADHQESPSDGVVQATGHVEPAEELDGERFAEMERILQDRGAVYYALEADQKDGYAYRFLCIMPAVGGNGAQQRFSAPGRTPTDAMRNVIRQVEQAGSRQP